MADSWRVRFSDEDCAQDIAARLGLRSLTARVLVARGISTTEQAAQFLSPRLADLRPPKGMADLDRAIDRLLVALHAGERVGVFGDYDVDGVTSAAVLVLLLRAMGLEVLPRMAERASGYGFSPAAAAWFVEQGCTLVMTADCGTSDHGSLDLCRRGGVDVVVIDHHEVPVGESGAYALLNSRRPDDSFAFQGLASCGVAFYLAAAVRSRLRAEGHKLGDCLEPRAWLDLVALGTVADMVPLLAENRILVAAGLRELSGLHRVGLASLASIAGLRPGILESSDVSFRLAPRLNAAGRLGNSQRALELLLAPDRATADRLAADLDDLNHKRQRIQEVIWAEAVRAAELCQDDPALVLGAEGWHQGVVGIVAAKLVEKYRKPTIVVGFAEGQGRGSARTLSGFNLYTALAECRAYLTGFGGHAVAAGVSLQAENLAAFRTAFLSVAQSFFATAVPQAVVDVDAIATLSELDLAQADELARLGPFGNANSDPCIVVPGLVARNTRVVGGSHLQLTLTDGRTVSEAIAFGMADQDPGQGARLDVVGTAEVDSFRGQRRIRLRLRHLLRSTSCT